MGFEDQFVQELLSLLPQERIRQKESMKEHTSLHIGGPADYFAMPSDITEIKSVIDLCRRENVPYYIIGNGSNLLVSDLGYRGMIIKLSENYSRIWFHGDGKLTAQAGISLSKLAVDVANLSLTGLEFASGIPGTLGGAVTMNAGAYDGEMKQCLLRARVLDRSGNVLELSNGALMLGYRSSIIQKEGYIVLEADIGLTEGDRQKIFGRMRELNQQRAEKQPLDMYSAGSTFKRPEGHFAGKLINESGLKGYQSGDAAVSEKHCGFIINKGNATAKDFLAVVNHVIEIIKSRYGITLEPEIKILGEF